MLHLRLSPNKILNILIVVAVTGLFLLFSCPSQSQDCLQNSDVAFIDYLLSHLSDADQSLMTTTAQEAVEGYPGSRETLMVRLSSWNLVQDIISSGTETLGPDEKNRKKSYNNRNYGYEYYRGGSVHVADASHHMRGEVFTSPLILDLDLNNLPDVPGADWRPHQGLDLSERLALFDINGDGFREVVEWIGPDDALLIIPESLDKVYQEGENWFWQGPVSARDLFGTAEGYPDGFAKFLQSDLNGDNILDLSELDGLFVWQDENGNAVIDGGELQDMTQLGISQLAGPSGDSCNGVFRRGDLEGKIWDWWPTYALSWPELTPDDATPPSEVVLQGIEMPEHSWQAQRISVLDESLLPRSELESAGFDFKTGTLLGVSPDGSWLVLTDQTTNPESISMGLPFRIWVFPVADLATGHIVPTVIPVPMVDMEFGSFENDYTLLCGSTQGAIFSVNLNTHAVSIFNQSDPDAGGFHCGPQSYAANGQVSVSGYFHNPNESADHECLALLQSNADMLTITEKTNLSQLHSTMNEYGNVGSEIHTSTEHGFFLVADGDGVSTLHMWNGTEVVALDQHVTLGGLAEYGNHILYVRENPDKGGNEVVLTNSLTLEKKILGNGDFFYPYFVNDGDLAVVAAIDWENGGMNIWSADLNTDLPLAPLMTLPSIAAVRVASQAPTLAALGADGLHFHTWQPTSSVPGQTPGHNWNLSNFPNPFNPRTEISFMVPHAGQVRVVIRDLAGHTLVVLHDGFLEEGHARFVWQGSDKKGDRVAAGTFLVEISNGADRVCRKISLIK